MELRLKYTYSKLSPEVIHPQATQRTMGSMQIPRWLRFSIFEMLIGDDLTLYIISAIK